MKTVTQIIKEIEAVTLSQNEGVYVDSTGEVLVSNTHPAGASCIFCNETDGIVEMSDVTLNMDQSDMTDAINAVMAR
jgi:hypothetical protein